MRVHTDHRRKAICDIFGDATPGDINVFVGHLGSVTCWHKHNRQTDRFFVLSGRLRVRWWKGSVFHQSILTPDDPAIEIAPGWWHGYAYEEEGTTVLHYADHKYDELDEIRSSETETGVPFM